jgi:hypothetical protein
MHIRPYRKATLKSSNGKAFCMLYRLAFAKTSEGLLRVTASIGRSSEHVVAIYQDDGVFLHLIRHAGLDPEIVTTLEREVGRAFGPAQPPTCCEDIELINDQLRFLRLGEARRLQVVTSWRAQA